MGQHTRLLYSRMVIYETLRLYPPAPAISRTAIGDDQVCGYKIRSGATVLTSQWVKHRSALYWEKPERFDPNDSHPSVAGLVTTTLIIQSAVVLECVLAIASR
jgi:cytochrome P450